LYLAATLTGLALAALSFAAEPVSFVAKDGGLVDGSLYGTGSQAVVLAHGGQFRKESWDKQAQVLAGSGGRLYSADTCEGAKALHHEPQRRHRRQQTPAAGDP
jgi:hypothetical protein